MVARASSSRCSRAGSQKRSMSAAGVIGAGAGCSASSPAICAATLIASCSGVIGGALLSVGSLRLALLVDCAVPVNGGAAIVAPADDIGDALPLGRVCCARRHPFEPAPHDDG